MQALYRRVVIISVVVLLGLSLVAGCGGSGESSPQPIVQPTDTPGSGQTPPPPPPEDVVITIGNLTDLTGVSANAQIIINDAMEDLVNHYNDNNLIPGIELEIETFDGQFDPSNDIPGYEWLRERGADLLVSCVPPTPVSLKPVVDEDQFVMFVPAGNLDELMPPGYVFSLGIVPEHCGYTLAKWISENHWDYKTKGPAKIGGAAWTDTASMDFLDAVKDYAEMHPDQFEFEGAHLNNFSFVWGPEVEALKDCDYVFMPTPMHAFVKQYYQAGYETTFIGADFQAAFMEMIDKGDLWEEIDGALFIRSSRWWSEEGPIIDLTRDLLFENHSSTEAEEYMRAGTGYLSLCQWYQMLEIIKDAVEAVGPQDFDSEALYNATVSYSETIDGIELYSFDKNKRISPNYYLVQEARAAEGNLFRADPEWLPALTGP